MTLPLSKRQHDLIVNLEDQADFLDADEDDLPKVLYRTIIVQAACMFRLLFLEGNSETGERLTAEQVKEYVDFLA